MRLRISDPNLSDDLLRYLRQRVDVVAAATADGELEISILGSRRATHNRLELGRRLRPWREAHPHVEVDVVG
jgi:hypothetical protein